MAFHPAASRHEATAQYLSSWQLILASVATVLALTATLCLWGCLGTTIFFETIRTGFAVCFG